jgi:hypothetical protein
MRDYGVVRVRFWAWAKRKKLSLEARDLALYLLTSPHGNSLGCFRLPMAYLCDDLDANAKAVIKSLDELKAVGFLERDEEDGWTWICDFLEHNPVPNSNVGKAIGKLVEQIPQSVAFYGELLKVLTVSYVDSDLIDTLLERYRNGFDRVSKPFNESVSGLKTHNQTQTQEHTQEQEHNPEAGGSAPGDDSQTLAAFNAWNESAARHPRWPKAQNLSSSRRTALQARLRDAEGPEGFVAALGKAEASRFIRDEMTGWSLDWFLKAGNFAKVREGNYDDAGRPGAPGASRVDGWEAQP